MSRFVSEFPTPEERSRSACRSCRRRKDCPYSVDRVWKKDPCLAAARQGEAAARRLTAEAGRFLAEISPAVHVRQLLRADDAVERTLFDILCGEVSLIAALTAESVE